MSAAIKLRNPAARAPAPGLVTTIDRSRPPGDADLLAEILACARARACDDLSRALIDEFGDVAGALSAEGPRLRRILGEGSEAERLMTLIRRAAEALGQASLSAKPVISRRADLIAYCRMAIGRSPREEVRLLHLDCDNVLIRDDVLARGTIDRAPLYIREAVRMALEANAASCIVAHNHPGQSVSPSEADIAGTRKLAAALKLVEVELHDHVIVSASSSASLRELGHLR